jgi:hypothetical protein
VKVDTSSRLIVSTGWIISILALIVGGIGVTNTMAMSVFERVREIGILRAVGWRTERIAGMIVCEALGICLLASAVGCALGVLAAQVFVDHSALSDLITPAFTAGTFAWGLAFALGVGCSARLYPTWRRSGWNRSKRCVENDAVAQAQRRSARAATLIVVRDEQDRHPALRAKRCEEVEHLRARRRIERAGRLVGEQQPRLVREGARDRDALALAPDSTGGRAWTRSCEADLLPAARPRALALAAAEPRRTSAAGRSPRR